MHLENDNGLKVAHSHGDYQKQTVQLTLSIVGLDKELCTRLKAKSTSTDLKEENMHRKLSGIIEFGTII